MQVYNPMQTDNYRLTRQTR